MKVTIEQIKGVNYTVVWHEDIDADVLHEEGLYDCYGFYICINGNRKVIATALPPIPRNPTADDAKLLYLYTSHSLNIHYVDTVNFEIQFISRTIKYCTDEQGNRFEIAIYDREL